MSTERLGTEGERLRFVERVFETFSWRHVPLEIWDVDHWDYKYYKCGFNPVAARDFDIQTFESHPFHSQGDRLCVMSIQGYLYYLPSFISLILEDNSSANDLGDSILGTLRSYPPHVGSIADWVTYSREQPPLAATQGTPEELNTVEFAKSLEDWFMRKTTKNQCQRIASMTQEERDVVALFLDRYDKLLDLEHLGNTDTYWIQSVRSVLRNGSYAERLGAKNGADILDLLELLNVAAEKCPASFSPRRVESIRKKLEQPVAFSGLEC